MRAATSSSVPIATEDHKNLLEVFVLPINHNRVLDVVRIAQHELEELGRSHRGEDRVFGRDRQAQHVHDVATLARLSEEFHRLEVT